MRNILGNSALPDYVKLTATAILGGTYAAALAVAVDVYVSQGPAAQLPNVVVFILGTGLSLALSVLGLHQGASLAEQQPGGGNGGGSTNASTPAA